MAHQVLRPTLDEVRVLAQEGTYRRVPVTRELYADAFTTIECLRALRAASNHVFLLESAEADQRWGRYSILGFDPTMEVTCLDGRLRVRTQVGTGHSKTTEAEIDHPGTYLREVLAAHRAPRIEGLPPFCGGLVGYFAYDYLKYAEPVLRRPQGSLGHEDFLDMDLMLFEKLVVFDAWRQKAVLIANARLDGAPVEDAYTVYSNATATVTFAPAVGYRLVGNATVDVVMDTDKTLANADMPTAEAIPQVTLTFPELPENMQLVSVVANGCVRHDERRRGRGG